MGELTMWELCLCDRSFWEQKLERILEIANQGVRFMMIDEMDWRGPCFDLEHGHDVPTSPLDHVKAVYELCRQIRQRCPNLTIECHDPIWSWAISIYVPTYFQQGFGNQGAYEENWGFEYMWDCVNDLKSGRALTLYYYNIGCNIPLYLHITMAADNDQCVFFWWAASTVRHLGIGGKYNHKSVDPMGKCTHHDPEIRFEAYRRQMGLYLSLKPYFVRGTFHGLDEHAHLHTLPDRKGGVLVMFNLTETDQNIEVSVACELLQSSQQLRVEGAVGTYQHGKLKVQLELPALSPAVVCIGDAVDDLKVLGGVSEILGR